MIFLISFMIIQSLVVSSIMSVSTLKPVEKPAFLQNMLTETVDSDNNDNTKKTDQHQKKTVAVKKRSLKSNALTRLIALPCNGIAFCGGKKLWDAIMPKHVRKAVVVGSIKLLDVASFIAGCLVLYGGYYLSMHKKDVLMPWIMLLPNTFMKFFNSVPSDATKNRPVVTDVDGDDIALPGYPEQIKPDFSNQLPAAFQ